MVQVRVLGFILKVIVGSTLIKRRIRNAFPSKDHLAAGRSKAEHVGQLVRTHVQIALGVGAGDLVGGGSWSCAVQCIFGM